MPALPQKNPVRFIAIALIVLIAILALAYRYPAEQRLIIGWTLVLAVILAIVAWMVRRYDADVSEHSILANSTAKKLRSEGYDLSAFFNFGDYCAGHPDGDRPVTHAMAYPGSDDLLFHQLLDKKANLLSHKPFIKIPYSKIDDVLIEDATTIERRLSATNILIFGAIGFLMRETEIHSKSFVTIQWTDGLLLQDSVFTFESLAEGNQARKTLLAILKAKHLQA